MVSLNSFDLEQLGERLGFRPWGETYGGPSLAEDSPSDQWDLETLSEQPSCVAKELYPHQLKSVYDMETFEKKKEIVLNRHQPNPGGFFYRRIYRQPVRTWGGGSRIFHRKIGIQADPVGYGKTLSMVTLIARDRMPFDLEKPWVEENGKRGQHYSLRYESHYKKISPTLIVASLSCLSQWKEDLKHTKLKVLVVKNRRTISRFCSPIPTGVVWDYDVVLCTPTMYNDLVRVNGPVVWKRFVFDEPAHVRIRSMLKIKAAFIWFVTATPVLVLTKQPGGSYIRNLFSEMQSALQLFTVKNPELFVQTSFSMPKTHYKDYLCFQPMARMIQGLVSPEVTQMVQAGDIRSAIEALGGTSTQKHNLVDILIERKDRELRHILFRLNEWVQRGDPTQTREWTQRKNEIERQIQELKNSGQEIFKSNCSICLEQLENPLLEPTCGKLFCAECILTWLTQHGTCPLCRSRIKPQELVHVDEDQESDDEEKKVRGEPKMLTKLQCIKKILLTRLSSDPTARFIVASEWIRGYNKIQKLMDDLEIPWCVISGAASSRDKLISSFKDGKVKAVYLSNLESTAGVNLQCATDIILYNEMGDSMRCQIIGRANRIGRKQELIVHTLHASR